MDAAVQRLVAAARHRRQRLHVASPARQPSAVRRVGVESRRARPARLRSRVGRRPLVAAGRRQRARVSGVTIILPPSPRQTFE